MTNDSKESTVHQGSRTGCLIWSLVAFGGLAVLVTGWLLWQGLPGKPIVVSRDTTYITEPLHADGLPDYEGYLLEKYRAGITPENNAGALLFQAFWPGELEPNDYQAVCDELGLDAIPIDKGALHEFPSDELLADVKTWLTSRSPAPDEVEPEDAISEEAIADENIVDDTYAEDVISAAGASAWTTSDLPPLAEWLAANESIIDLVVAATRRSHYYLPSPSLLNDNHEMLIAMLLPGVQGTRHAARALSLRAMRHLGAGRLDEAWNDTLALHRLASLANQAHTVVEKLVAIALRAIANDATLAILSDDNLSLDLARRIQADLSGFDRRVSLHDTLATFERISSLDAAAYSSKYGIGQLSDEPVAPVVDTSSYKVDWNVVLIDLNDWYDKLELAIEHADYGERRQAIDEFESKLDNSGREVKHPLTLAKALVSRRARSKMIGTIYANLMIPALSAAITAEERNTAIAQLVDVGAALAVYRAQHGKYPAALADLTPEILPQLPTDSLRANDLVYQREGTGYLLYSLGQNGDDESGSNELMGVAAGRRLTDVPEDERTAHLQEIPPAADDYSILLPRPNFKLPTPTANP